MKKQSLIFLLCLLWALPVRAQTGVSEYTWYAGDLALVYPSNWETPVEDEQDGQYYLHMAQTLTASPEVRPPGIPFITLAVIPDAPDDLSALLHEALTQLDLRVRGRFPAYLGDTPGIMLTAERSDGVLFGEGYAVPLPDEGALLLYGRALADQRDAFSAQLAMVAESIVYGANFTAKFPAYGIVWHSERTRADGDEAFLDIVDMSAGLRDDLYVLDSGLGVLRLDAATGIVLAQFPFADAEWQPSSLAVSPLDGRVFVTDMLCACVRVLNRDGRWTFGLGGFGPEAPRSATTAGGALYFTDQTRDGVIVRAFDGAALVNIGMDETVSTQPLLVADRFDQLLALADDGQVWLLQDGTFVLLYDLPSALPVVEDAVIDANNSLVLLTQDGSIVVFDPQNDTVETIWSVESGEIVPVYPQAVSVDLRGTVYWADADGSFGAVTALSARVGRGRMGERHLTPNLPVVGMLDANQPRQFWTFDGFKGQQITLTALDLNQTETFDLALRLLGPDGSEEAFNDNDETRGTLDSQISDHLLQQDGRYMVVVERVAGEGEYTLGLVLPRLVDVPVELLRGELFAAAPAQRWAFAGRAGQRLTITLSAVSGDLDPLLRLRDASGAVIAENDDADDPALGRDSQLVDVRLPAGGTYVIEAASYSGAGRYLLEIIPAS